MALIVTTTRSWLHHVTNEKKRDLQEGLPMGREKIIIIISIHCYGRSSAMPTLLGFPERNKVIFHQTFTQKLTMVFHKGISRHDHKEKNFRSSIKVSISSKANCLTGITLHDTQ